MKIRFWIMVFFVVVGMIFLVPSSAAEVATVGVSVEGVAWSEETVEVYLELGELPPTGVSGVFLCLDIEGGTVENAEVTGAWCGGNARCEWRLHQVTVMLDATENILSVQPFLKVVIQADGGEIVINTRAAAGGGVYAYEGDGVKRLPFAEGAITLSPPDTTDHTSETTETEETPDETVAISPARSYYVGYQQGIDDARAVRFLVLERKGERGGAAWCTRGGGRLILSVERCQTVRVYREGKRVDLPARLPDGCDGVWCVYTFRGLTPGAAYEFCVEDEGGITRVGVTAGIC